jgi:hypothetical protein
LFAFQRFISLHNTKSPGQGSGGQVLRDRYIRPLPREIRISVCWCAGLLRGGGGVGCCCSRGGSAGQVRRRGCGRTRGRRGASGELDDDRARGGCGESALVCGDVVYGVGRDAAGVDLDGIHRDTVDDRPEIEVEACRRPSDRRAEVVVGVNRSG